ncbi:MAG: hypothetical protein GC168_17830 [Candidatus Hydrogenedens sp.]|nr:hypothetical protein [Candidatus Hydrogenedens sp.]
MVRTTDHVNWTELNAGNYYELQVYDDADVRLVSFAGYLWLGGAFKITHTGITGRSGRLWRSRDGVAWELASQANSALRYAGGSLASYEDTIYRLPGDGFSATYQTIATCEEILGGVPHSADLSGCGVISLSELLRVIQFYTTQGYRCDPDSEDGYVARANTPVLSGSPDPDKVATVRSPLTAFTPARGDLTVEAVAGSGDPATTKLEGEGLIEGAIEGTIEGAEGETCVRHSADYNEPAWRITLPELLRMIQLYNAGAYHPCPTDGGRPTEDGFCPGK